MFFESLYTFVTENKLLYAVVIVVLFSVLAKAMTHVMHKLIKRYYKVHNVKKRDRHYIDDMQIMIGILILLFGFQYLSYSALVVHYLYDKIIISLIVITVTYIVVEFSELIISVWSYHRRSRNEEFTTEVMPLMRGMVKILFVIIGFIIVLGIWGVPILSLVTSVGVISVVLGFALQDTLKNIFGGISLIADDAFRVNDVIKIPSGDYANEIGEVIAIGLRSTQIKTYDSQILMIPNGVLVNQSIINYARPTKEIRIVIPVSVAYGSDYKRVEEVLLECVKGKHEILKHPRPQVWFDELADYSLNFRLIIYIQNYRHMFTLKSKMNGVILDAFRKNKIKIPFPTQKIFFEKN